MQRNKEARKLAAPIISRGLKKNTVDTSVDTLSEISALQGLEHNMNGIQVTHILFLDDLLKMLEQERIERTVVRSQATYSVENNGNATIRVTRKMGKWNQFGHVNGNDGLCLTEHEALFLIEMVIVDNYIFLSHSY